MTDTCTVLTAQQRAELVAAAYRLVDFATHTVKTFTAGDARREETAALLLHSNALLDLLQEL